MALQAGQLLWNHKRITLGSGNTEIDTGLTLVNQALTGPTVGVRAASIPAAGALPSTTLQILPMPSIALWMDITVVGEPWFSTVTNTMHVTLNNSSKTPLVDVNIFFFFPHTIIGPGLADTYNHGS